jgi:hypothetical protein
MSSPTVNVFPVSLSVAVRIEVKRFLCSSDWSSSRHFMTASFENYNQPKGKERLTFRHFSRESLSHWGFGMMSRMAVNHGTFTNWINLGFREPNHASDKKRSVKGFYEEMRLSRSQTVEVSTQRQCSDNLYLRKIDMRRIHQTKDYETIDSFQRPSRFGPLVLRCRPRTLYSIDSWWILSRWGRLARKTDSWLFSESHDELCSWKSE